jgi:hypothetical protein
MSHRVDQPNKKPIPDSGDGSSVKKFENRSIDHPAVGDDHHHFLRQATTITSAPSPKRA